MNRTETRIGFVIALLVGTGVAAGLAVAEDENEGMARHSESAIVPEDRYEIIQSSLYADITIRLDKYSGRTWELVDRSGNALWQEIRWTERGDDSAVRVDGVNYQFLTSGLKGTPTFLWNVHTGRTWFLNVEPQRRNFLWKAVLDT